MSASARALCQIIEERPFIALTVTELELLHRATANMATLARQAGKPAHHWTALAAKLSEEMQGRSLTVAMEKAFIAGQSAGRNYPIDGRPSLTPKGLAALRESEDLS